MVCCICSYGACFEYQAEQIDRWTKPIAAHTTCYHPTHIPFPSDNPVRGAVAWESKSYLGLSRPLMRVREKVNPLYNRRGPASSPVCPLRRYQQREEIHWRLSFLAMWTYRLLPIDLYEQQKQTPTSLLRRDPSLACLWA